MTYYQQTIDFDAIKASIDDMFPVKRKSKPEPSAAVFCEKWTDYRGETADWLREMPNRYQIRESSVSHVSPK